MVLSNVLIDAKGKFDKDSKGFVKKQISVSLIEVTKELPYWTKNFEMSDYLKDNQENNVKESAKVSLPGVKSLANLHYV